MFESYIKRENDIFDILQVFLDNRLDFVVIGGYAISAFKHRFSVDADVVIMLGDEGKFEDLLKENGFKKTISKDLENVYSSRFVRYEKKEELKVSVDLLIGGVGIRQTGGAIGFDKIRNNSIRKKVKGIEKEVMIRIPVKEMLIAMKLQAGRLTDYRDIVVLCKTVDVEKVKEFLGGCDKGILKEHVNNLLGLLGKIEFIDSFKGVFMEKKYDVDIEEVRKLVMGLGRKRW